MNTISYNVVKNISKNRNNKLLAEKINNNWIWHTNQNILDNISYCKNKLNKLNINKGDRIVYKGKNSKEWLSWNIATNSLGAIWVPLYNDQNKEYCQYIINDSNPSLVICDDEISNNNNIKQIKTHIKDNNNNNNLDYTENDIATLIYTSGTTGNPKGVMLSNENILSNVYNIRERFINDDKITSLNLLPWAHIYSQTCELYYNILSDNKIAISQSKDTFLKDLKEIKPEALYLVPRVLELIKNKLSFLDTSLTKIFIPTALKYIFGGNLKHVFLGGAKLNEDTKYFFENNGIVICEGYGCTETSPIVSVNHSIYPRNIESIGKILDSVVVEIINDEIQVSGPSVMLGYWKDKKSTDKALKFRDNRIWYLTGDKGEIKDGYLYYKGRISENYKLSNGKFVTVENLENKISKIINNNFIVFGENMDFNCIITDKDINQTDLDKINNEIDSYLKIRKVYTINNNEWCNFLTPKMSIKRKKLIEYVLQK